MSLFRFLLLELCSTIFTTNLPPPVFNPEISLKKRVKPSFDLWVDILGSGLCWWAPKTLTCGLKFVFVGFKPFSFSLGLLVMFVWASYIWA